MSRLSGFVLETTTPSAWTAFTASTIETANFTVPGARVGDFVWVAVECTSTDLSNVVFQGQVTAADTVTVAAFPDAQTTGLAAVRPMTIKVVPKDAI